MNTLFLRKDETISLGLRRSGYAWVLYRQRSGLHTLLIRKAFSDEAESAKMYGSVCFLNEVDDERGSGRAHPSQRCSLDKGDSVGVDALGESYLSGWVKDR